MQRCHIPLTVLICLVFARSGEAVSNSSAPHKCIWPHCLPKCSKCHADSIDTCWLSFIGLNTCESRYGNSSCFIGRCICEPGLCANEVEPGKWECQPPVCEDLDSPSAPHFHPSLAQRIFLLFTTTDEFPHPSELDSNFEGWLWTIILLPAMMLVMGTTAACCLWYCLCCGSTGHHFSKGRLEKSIDEDLDDDLAPLKNESSSSDDDADSGGSGGRKKVRRPDSRCLCFLMVCIVVLTTYVVVRRTMIMQEIFQNARNLFEHSDQEAQLVAEQAVRVNATCQKFMHEVRKLVRDCAQYSIIGGVVKTFEGKIDEDLDTYQQMLANYSSLTVSIPPEIEMSEKKIMSQEPLFVIMPSVPNVFLAVVCLAIIGEVLVISMKGGSACANSADHCLRIAAVAFVIIIVFITISAVVSSFLGTGLSQFCKEPDINTRNFIKHYSNSTVGDNAATHYMEGHVVNPIRTMTNIAKRYIVNIDDIYKEIRPVIEGAEGLCHDERGLNVTALAVEVVQVLGTANSLLAGEHLWPIYRDIVRHGVCYDVVQSLGLSILFLVVMGMVLFPLSAILAHKFLVDWANYEESLTKGEAFQ